MFKLFSCYFIFIFALAVPAHAFENNANAYLTVEEERLLAVKDKLSNTLKPVENIVERFTSQVKHKVSFTMLMQIAARDGNELWKTAVKQFDYDKVNTIEASDLSLYWARLTMLVALKQSQSFHRLLPMQREKLLSLFKTYSRGVEDITYQRDISERILFVVFDPSYHSNGKLASSIANNIALSFDSVVLSQNSKKIQYQSISLPYRFQDLDKGIVETILSNVIKRKKVTTIITLGNTNGVINLGFKATNVRHLNAIDNLNVQVKDKFQFIQSADNNNKKIELNALSSSEQRHVFSVIQKRSLVNNFGMQQFDDINADKFMSESNELLYRALTFNKKYALGIKLMRIDLPQNKILSGRDFEQLNSSVSSVVANFTEY